MSLTTRSHRPRRAWRAGSNWSCNQVDQEIKHVRRRKKGPLSARSRRGFACSTLAQEPGGAASSFLRFSALQPFVFGAFVSKISSFFLHSIDCLPRLSLGERGLCLDNFPDPPDRNDIDKDRLTNTDPRLYTHGLQFAWPWRSRGRCVILYNFYYLESWSISAG